MALPYPSPAELGSKFQALGNRAVVTSNITAPSGITDSVVATNYMVGLGVLVTPNLTGCVEVFITGTVNNTTGSDGAALQISYGTGSAPAKNAAVTGTLVGNIFTDSTSGTALRDFALSALIQGLVPGTTYWFDIAQQALVGGAVVFTNNICVQIKEY